jgi:hypothetical protein
LNPRWRGAEGIARIVARMVARLPVADVMLQARRWGSAGVSPKARGFE